MNNAFDKFLTDYLYPILAGLVLCIFLTAQSRASDGSPETISDALAIALHDCRNTGDYAHMECATVIIAQTDGTFRLAPLTVGTERTFRLRYTLFIGEKLVAIFHTHPGRDANADLFSDMDVRVAEKLEIPSYIYVLRTAQMRVYFPTHFVLSTSASQARAGKRVT
jgi:proteasome lid subunit RPN8/RPN11